MPRLLIISATSDMAKACARLYAEKGFDLVLASRNLEETEILAKDISLRFNKNVECHQLNVQDYASHTVFVDKLVKSGGISGCISFTGYLGEQAKAQSDTEELIKIVESNYLGLANLLELIAKHMEEKKEGFIVGVSSVAGDRGRKSNYHYGAAKAAFSTFLSGLRNRLQENNVHVMTVKPGFVNTKMTSELDLPATLTAEPEEVANRIYKSQQKKRNVIYIKSIWFLIMLVIKHIPETIFKKTDL